MNAARQLRGNGGIGIRAILKYCGVSRNALYHVRKPRKAKRFDLGVLAGIEEISRRRPTYGSRRLAAQATRELGRPVNRKQAQRIARAIGIISPPDGKKDVIRKARKPRFRPTGPNQLWETDITYVWCGSTDGWGYCFNVVDVFTRQWVSHVFSTYATADVAVQSITKALAAVSPEKRRDLIIRCDNGTQYTSRAFRENMKALKVRIEYIWHHTPQQNGHVESFHGTLKREYIWPHEFARFQDAEEVLEEARRDYNNERIHSSLGYVTPDEFVTEWRDRNGRKRQK